MSEHDWQATVLNELGIPHSGLITPDSSGRPPFSAIVPDTDRGDARPGQVTDGQPSAAASGQRQGGTAAAQDGPAVGDSWPADAAPPVDPMRSVPEPPEFPVTGQERQGPPPARPPADGRPRPVPASRDQAPAQSWGQAPAQSWDQALSGAWERVAQPHWGPPATAPAAHERRAEWAEPEAGRPGEAGPAPGPAAPGNPAGRLAPGDLARRTAHGDPLMRRTLRGVRRAVGASAAHDIREAADVEGLLGRAVPSCRKIAVTSIRGGAGKTTVAGLTATVIAQYRRDRVIAVDADSGLGSLPLRLGVTPHASLHDLASAHPRSFEEASRFLAYTADGLWVLSGTSGGRISAELDLARFHAAVGAMTRYFATAVIDCGAGMLPALQRGILADAHAQVVVTPGTADGAISVQGALEWQARNGFEPLLGRTVIAFVTHTPHVAADLTRAAQLLSAGGMPVVHLPYDRHLAAGTAVESARIGQETRAAVIRVALESFARATSV